jgi:hypothetical protein
MYLDIANIYSVAEKYDFRDIQRKISNFAQKRDSNPPPHGDTAADRFF